ncbi:MAG: Fic family protein [Anaerolineales bacterium]|jgi:Fic family protein|nr:Fic family protein [Anaerolineales bacterium]
MSFEVQKLPPAGLEETRPILKKLALAHRYLAELKGVAASIPNQTILINTLALQEAKDSSAIENIITTHDDLYKAELFSESITDAATKEVSRYADALRHGFGLVQKHHILTLNHILEIQRRLEQNDAGIRKLSGTALVNQASGQVVYSPPQDYETVLALMGNLVEYINRPEMHEVDPLVKMAVIHHQFESIHPFYDGNGRTGRIINILYLVQENLLSLPILYLSRYIIANKAEYYRLLQEVRDTGQWEAWIMYILDAVEKTSQETIALVDGIKNLMMDYKHRIRAEHSRLYSQDLINNLFRHPYTKIDFLTRDLNVTRLTATRYLDTLTESGFLVKEKIGRSNYYVNLPLFELLTDASAQVAPAPPIVTRNPPHV